MTDYEPQLRAVREAHALDARNGRALRAWTDAHNDVIELARRDLEALRAAVCEIAITAHDRAIVTHLAGALDGFLATQRMAVGPDFDSGLDRVDATDAEIAGKLDDLSRKGFPGES